MNRPQPLILVVEDHQPTRELLSDCLAAEGYRVESVASGRRGLARVGAGDVDAVLLDLHLPDIDGWALCRQLREDEISPAMPIILMSAETEQGQRSAALAAGASDYLVKPFDVEDLLATVTHHCAEDGTSRYRHG
jgi:two-component system OmpR family response regulator